MDIDETVKSIFAGIGINYNSLPELNGILIERDILLSVDKYNAIKAHIPKLKQVFSSSCMTCLQSDAIVDQRWPLLNLVRQILHVYNFVMKPIRKSDGYTLDGVKKYKRFFQIEQKKLNASM